MTRKRGLIIASIAVGAVLAAAAVIWMTQPSPSSSDDQQGRGDSAIPETTITEIEADPVLIETSEAYFEYVEEAVDPSGGAVHEQRMHLIDDIDWNASSQVAIPFSIPSSRTFTGVGIEEIDGAQSYVIDVLGAPSGCAATQDNVKHVAFIEQSDASVDYPVMMRTAPNSASCDF